jgi:predicted dithiol-disulfide oxidoreductase (DUF899 family)
MVVPFLVRPVDDRTARVPAPLGRVHLDHRDVTTVSVCCAPLFCIETCKWRVGWSSQLGSSFHDELNYDFGVFYPKDRRAGAQYDDAAARR